VLIVDDDTPVRRALTRSLSRVGFTVLEAADGATALEMATAHKAPIELLLTNAEMPGLPGAKMAEQLRGLFPKLHVLFMSGASSENDHPLQPPDGSPQYRFVAKPFTTDELTAAVRAALSGSPQ